MVVELEGADYSRLVVTVDDVGRRGPLPLRRLSARTDLAAGAAGLAGRFSSVRSRSRSSVRSRSGVGPGRLEADGAGHVALGHEADAQLSLLEHGEPGPMVPAHDGDGVLEGDVDIERDHVAGGAGELWPDSPHEGRDPWPRPGPRCRGSPSPPGSRRSGTAVRCPRPDWPGSRQHRPPCPWSGGPRRPRS